jgi:hypothetical protein
VALPDASGTININAASDALLTAYKLNDTQISALHSTISQDGYVSADAFTTLGFPKDVIGVTSNAFCAHITVLLNGRVTHLNSTLIRSRDNISSGNTSNSSTSSTSSNNGNNTDSNTNSANGVGNGNNNTNNSSNASNQKAILTVARTWSD